MPCMERAVPPVSDRMLSRSPADPVASGNWTTRANALTLLRLLAAPALVVCIVASETLGAALVFALAVGSDLADGWIARRFGEASPLGGSIDHAVDALFVSSGSAALAWLHVLPAALPPLIALAFAQYALDSRCARSGALRASALGRWNGIAYYAIVGLPIVRDALGSGWPGAQEVRGIGWLLVVTTLASMLDRARAARRAPRPVA
ncbi:MAG: CDP-alcohol phosphatidyltransferase family protein [Myxococcales bacterium]|nr:CDP-alcohol phosphatidyltransferase family protein [Myxococcales bacterium]MDH5307336.1 CDP-alcohol phosphatidyltransferase family protein [Myxococcales bacterium]